MIKFTAKSTAAGTIIGLGLSRLNCERLIDGKPIVINTKRDLGTPYEITILLCGGEDEKSIVADLERQGFDMPDDPDKIHIDAKVGG